MSGLDIDALLQPLSSDSPAGEDLEYELPFTELLALSQGEPDRYVMVKDPEDNSRDIERLIPGSPPDARAIHKAALALFDQTRDLRVAVKLAYAETRLNGLPGLAEGLSLIAALLDQYWQTLHPLLDAEDDNDPFMRINALNELVDPASFLRAVMQAPLAEARAVGRFVVRDIDVANGDEQPEEGQAAATIELIRAACQQQDEEQLQARLLACEQSLKALQTIQATFSERTWSTPNLDRLVKVLKGVLNLYRQFEQAGGKASIEEEVVMEHGVMPVEAAASVAKAVFATPDKIASREDARKQLQRVCDYLEQHEPAHPSSLLIRRAIRLLDMNFLDIIAELSPDALDGIHHLAGIRPDEDD